MTMTVEQKKLIIREAKRESARRSYRSYVKSAHHGNFEHYAHTDLICDYLQRIVDGDQMHLMIEMPPRHGKSMTVTETFPSYFLMKNPTKRVITSAYSEGLARKFGRLNRNKFEEFSNELFNLNLSADNNSTTDWGLADYNGGMIATGIGGSITGQGADCFPQGTMIDTEMGKIDIKELHEMENPPLVLSYNHDSSKLEYKKIEVTRRKQADEFTKISTIGGNEIISTQEHRYYDFERGYREANLFRPDDKLTVQAIEKEHRVYGMWRTKEWQRDILQRMLPIGKKENSYFTMQFVWKSLRKIFLRIQQSDKKKSSRFLLLNRMFEKTPFIQKFKRLLLLWWKQKERQQILQSGMYEQRQTTTQKEKGMPDLSKSILPTISQNSLLFEDMRRCIAFRKNDGQKQQSLQRRHELCKRIFRYSTIDIKTGPIQMPYLWTRRKYTNNIEQPKTNKFSNTPYGRGHNEQHSKEFDNTMHHLSHQTPQIKGKSIRNIENYRQPNTIVYDIQVADNNNFFANGLLVHNCMIIDDPIKNAKEAQSKTIRENIWDEWESTLSTRLHDGASVIVIMTRCHQDDFIGRLLEQSPYDWKRLRLPAIAEDDDDLLNREVGEPLCRELGFDEEWAELKKREVGSRTWASLYQQRPSPAQGTIFKREWVQYYDRVPPRYDDMLMSWDFTFKDSESSDYAVGQVWIKQGADFYLIDQIRAKMDFTQSVRAVESMKNKHPKCRKILIEDKANGPAIITTLKQKVSGIIPITPKESKVARAYAVTPFFEAGNVFVGKKVPSVEDFIDELTMFDNAVHDDTVDAMTQALNYFASKPTASVITGNAW